MDGRERYKCAQKYATVDWGVARNNSERGNGVRALGLRGIQWHLLPHRPTGPTRPLRVCDSD